MSAADGHSKRNISEKTGGTIRGAGNSTTYQGGQMEIVTIRRAGQPIRIQVNPKTAADLRAKGLLVEEPKPRRKAVKPANKAVKPANK